MFPILFRIPEWVPLLGGEPITSFGFMMFLAFLAGGAMLQREMRRMELPEERAWDLLFMAVVGGIVGAKLYYILLNWRLAAADPAFLLSRGGLVWYGGFLLATALVVWQIRRYELPLGRMADAVAVVLPVGYAIGRFGCFLVGDDYGRPTASVVGMRFPEGAPPTTVEALRRYFGVEVDPALIEQFGEVIPVHPTQLYEVAMSLAIFWIVWRLREHLHTAGWLFMLWLALAGVERFVVEIFRAKDDRFLGPLTVAQVISVGLVVVGIVGMQRLRGSSDLAGSAPSGGSSLQGQGS